MQRRLSKHYQAMIQWRRDKTALKPTLKQQFRNRIEQGGFNVLRAAGTPSLHLADRSLRCAFTILLSWAPGIRRQTRYKRSWQGRCVPSNSDRLTEGLEEYWRLRSEKELQV